MRTWAIITALVFATLDRPLAEVADDFNPSFLQAAIFFVMGREPPKDVKFDSDRLAIVLSVITDQMGAHDAKHEFNVSKQEPCTINMTLLEPPYGMGRLEFMKLPSPRAMRITGENVHMDLPPETWCNSKAEVNSEGFVQSIKGTSMCLRKVQLVGHVFRRLAALDYIRDHFCAGQPEPPPPPPQALLRALLRPGPTVTTSGRPPTQIPGDGATRFPERREGPGAKQLYAW